jgi:hypothetical protein
VCFLLYLTNLLASKAIFSKISLMKEFIMAIDFFETPVSLWTCLSTL